MTIGTLEFLPCTHSYLVPLVFFHLTLSLYLCVIVIPYCCDSLLPNYFGWIWSSSNSKHHERSSHIFKITLKFGRKFIYSLLSRLHRKRPYISLFISVPDSHFLQFSRHVYIGHRVGKKGLMGVVDSQN